MKSAKVFTVFLLILSMFVLSACSTNEGKTSLDLFTEEGLNFQIAAILPIKNICIKLCSKFLAPVTQRIGVFTNRHKVTKKLNAISDQFVDF